MKIEIDPEIFAKNLSETIFQALVKSQPVDSSPPQKKKRGRPSKKQTVIQDSSQIEKIELEDNEAIEDVKTILEEKVEVKSWGKIIAPAKNPNWTPPKSNPNGSNIPTKTQTVKASGAQKFIDIKNVPPDVPNGVNRNDPKYYPDYEVEMTRNPAKKLKFVCSKCRVEFEAYPSEVPQAFLRFNDEALGVVDDRPAVKCNNCSTV